MTKKQKEKSVKATKSKKAKKTIDRPGGTCYLFEKEGNPPPSGAVREGTNMKRFFAHMDTIIMTSMILGLPVLGVVVEVPEIMPSVVSKSEAAPSPRP